MVALTDFGRPHVVCSRKDGMGARLSNLLWTWRLARRVGARTLCFWPPLENHGAQGTVAGELIDIYALATSPLAAELQVVDGRPVDHVRPEFVEIDPRQACDPAAFLTDPAVQTNPPTKVIQTAIGPLLMGGETREDAMAEARALFERLPARKNIRESVRRAAKQQRPRWMVAVHVRRGDIVEVLRSSCAAFTEEALRSGSVLERYTEHFFRCCAPVQTYQRLLRPYLNKGYRILFFSDSAEAAAPFVERFGDKVVLAADLAPPGLSSLQQAMFELQLMGRCKVILGSKSMFGSLAALTGGTELVDVRRHSRAAEFVAAYHQAIGLEDLGPSTRAGVLEVVERHVDQNYFLGRTWKATGKEVRHILETA